MKRLLILILLCWCEFAFADEVAFLPRGGAAPSDPMTVFLATVSPGHWAQIGPQGGDLGTSPTTPHTVENVVCYLNASSLTPTPPDAGLVDPSSISGSWRCRAAEGVWSGASYDTTDNWVILSSGNHLAYCGNELYAFDVNNLIWMRLSTPDPLSAYGPGVSCYSGGFPNPGANGDSPPNHNYGGNGFLAHYGTHGAVTFNGNWYDMAVFFGPAFALCNYTGPAPDHQVVKSPCNPTPHGTPQSGNIFNYTSHCGMFVQQDMTGNTDSTAGTGGLGQEWLSYYPVGGGCPKPWERYDLGTGIWDEPSLTPIGGPYSRAGEWDHAVSVFRTAGGRHQIWLIGMSADDYGPPTTLAVVDTVALTYWRTTDTSLLPPSSYYGGVAYDSKRDKIVVMPDGRGGPWGGNLEIITPADPPNAPSAVLHTTAGGSAIPNIGCDGNYPCTDGIMTRFVYDAKHNCYLLFADYLHDVWLYKPDF